MLLACPALGLGILNKSDADDQFLSYDDPQIQWLDLSGNKLRSAKIKHLERMQSVDSEIFDLGGLDINVYDSNGVKNRTLHVPPQINILSEGKLLPDKRMAFISAKGKKGMVSFTDATCHLLKEVPVNFLDDKPYRFLCGIAVKQHLFLLCATQITSIDLNDYAVSIFSTFPDFVNYPADWSGQHAFDGAHARDEYNPCRMTYAAGKLYFLWGQQVFASAKGSHVLQPIFFNRTGQLRGITATSGRLFALVDDTFPTPRKKRLESYLYEVHPQDGTMTKLLQLPWQSGLTVLRDPATPDLPIPEPKAQFFNTN